MRDRRKIGRGIHRALFLAVVEGLEQRRLLAGKPAIDTVIFGNSTSESAHSFSSNSTQAITGGLGQSARQLLPLSTVGVNGGDMTVVMSVDPVTQNYFTLKLWGNDDTDMGKGRLYLYVPIAGVDYQIGYRHEGDYAPLNVAAGAPALPNRFFYSTTMLPLSMTAGKTTLTLKIVSTGELYGLGSGGPPSGNYQMNMDTTSRGIYRAYTHTQPMLEVGGETQGTAPTVTTRPSVSENSVLGTSGTYTLGLKNWSIGKMSAAITSFTTSDVQMLANSYSITQFGWSTTQRNSIVNKVIAVIDGFASDYYTNPSTSITGSSGYGAAAGNEVWGGRFGPLGWAIHLLNGVSAFSSQLDTSVDFGTIGGIRTRREAWGDMLEASRDYGRANRRTLTNQTILANINVYKANRALLDLGDINAFTENSAQRYLLESVGIEPWLGNDLSNGNSDFLYGDNYYQVTLKGLTREWGYAGAYSEMALYAANFYRWTGNVQFKNQAVKMIKASANMRRPAIEVSGSNNYRSAERIGLLAWRGVREADGYYKNDITYGGATSWSAGMIVAGVTLDPYAIGYAKQMLADNQYLNNLISDSRYYSSLSFDALNAFDVYSDYFAVKSATDSGVRLPMTSGQADYAWTDEEDGIAVVKQGETRFWVEPYWQAKTGTGINGLAKFYYSTPIYEQYGILQTNVNYTHNGGYFVRPNYVNMPENNNYVPPDNPTQGLQGEMLPIGFAPGNAGTDTPFRGKANYYGFRFGNYLIGMNSSTNGSYTLKTPLGFSSATDLIGNTTKSGTIPVAPLSTVILNLGTYTDAAPVPSAPLLITAIGSPTSNTINWSAASGAASYTVKRSQTPGGPYATLASNLTTTTFTDTAVSRAAGYYYVVSAVNSNGESYNSSEANTSAGLPNAWSSADTGTVALAGSSSISGSTFTLRGSGGDVGGTSDTMQYSYTTLTGDGSFTARVTNAGNTNSLDKVGIMYRDSLNSGAMTAALVLEDASNMIRLANRTSLFGGMNWSSSTSNIGAPYWLRLTRSGNLFTGSISPDGISWTTVSSATVSMASTAAVGMFVCSRYSQQLNVSTFDSVSLTGLDTTPPTVTSINRIGATPTSLKIAQFSVLFSEPVTGVDVTDFVLNSTGLGAASILSVTGSGSSYTVTVNTGDGTGNGTLGLSLTDNDSIKDSLGQPLGGSDAANGNFNGENFTIYPHIFNGSSGSDIFQIKANGANDEIYINSILSYTIARSQLPSLSINGQGGNDLLILDYSAGDPTPLSAITFDGGLDTDTVEIRGASASDVIQFNSPGVITHGLSNSSIAGFENYLFATGSFYANINLGNINLVADGSATTIHLTNYQSLNSLNLTAGSTANSASSDSSNIAMVVGSLSIGNGSKLNIATNGGRSGVSRFGTISISSTGKLDLNDNDLIIDYGAGNTPIQAINQLVKSGLTLLNGNGYGIGSSLVDAQNTGGTMLAVVDDGDPLIGGTITEISGYAIPNPGSSVLVKYTWFGDSNLDGTVDGSDYALIDTGFTSGNSLGGWVFGDYDYNGLVDSSDYALIDTGFISQTGFL